MIILQAILQKSPSVKCRRDLKAEYRWRKHIKYIQSVGLSKMRNKEESVC